MGICYDDSIKALKKVGYNVVRLPRADIHPLQLIGVARGESMQIGSLTKLLTEPGSATPPIKRNVPVTSVNGQRSSSLSLGLGLNVLGAIIGAMGGNAGFKAHYKGAKKLTFEYADVLGDSVEPIEVGRFLARAEIDYSNPLVDQFVLGNGRLYVITRTVKSKKFRVEATRSDGAGLEVDVDGLKDVLGGKVSVAADASSSSTVSFAGDTPLVFGFQCLELGLNAVSDDSDGGDLTLTIAAAGDIALGIHDGAGDPRGDAMRPAMLGGEGLVDLGVA